MPAIVSSRITFGIRMRIIFELHLTSWGEMKLVQINKNMNEKNENILFIKQLGDSYFSLYRMRNHLNQYKKLFTN